MIDVGKNRWIRKFENKFCLKKLLFIWFNWDFKSDVYSSLAHMSSWSHYFGCNIFFYYLIKLYHVSGTKKRYVIQLHLKHECVLCFNVYIILLFMQRISSWFVSLCKHTKVTNLILRFNSTFVLFRIIFSLFYGEKKSES